MMDFLNAEKIYLNIKQAVESAQHKVYATANFVMEPGIWSEEDVGHRDE